MSIAQARGARDGFTLMEILIAVAIVAIMGVLVGPNIMNRFMGAKRTAAKTSLKGLKDTIQIYYMDNSKYPEKLRDLTKKPASAKNWSGPYLKDGQLPEDPWGERFQYKFPGTSKKGPYDLYSYGENSRGAPKDEWISVWDA